MKTIKDLKNYVKSTSRYCIKDYLDPMCFYQLEYDLLMEERNKVKKRSKAIYKEFRDILNKDDMPLIVGNYGVTGRLRISENKIHYVPGQDARMEIHNHLRAYLETNYR
tara:strand:+ start:753 stop:1079 length:327 start_codon:yes stop_codon:yes gene_type:complete